MTKNYNFKNSFNTILWQVDPSVTQMQKMSKDLLNDLLINLAVKIIQSTIKTINTETVLHTDIIISTRKILPKELSKYAIDFMMKAIDKYDKADKDKEIAKERYAKLQFKISTSHAIIEDNISKDQKIHETSSVALAALLEYIFAEIIILSVSATLDKRKRRITKEIVIDEIRNDNDLNQLFIENLQYQ